MTSSVWKRCRLDGCLDCSRWRTSGEGYQCRSSVCTSLREIGRIFCIDSSPLTKDRHQMTVKTMDFSGWICSEESKNGPIGRKGNGHDFMGLERNNPRGLLRKGRTITGQYHTKLLDRFDKKLREAWPHDNGPAQPSGIVAAKICLLY